MLFEALTVVLAGLAIAALGLTVVTDIAARRVLRRPETVRRAPTPHLSVLKPLKGLDDGLYENLASLARQDYPSFEIHFGAEDPNDPALAVARALQRAFPGVAMSLHVCGRRLGLNPKISVLHQLAEKATSDIVLISDSNVRLEPDYLRAMAAELADPGVGLVTSLVIGAGERSVGAVLENLHAASYVLRAVAAAREVLGHACVIGKSMLFRVSELQRLGGWHGVRDVLAEDYVIGQWFAQAGRKVAISARPVVCVNERWGIDRFCNRHLRWAQMRRRVSLGAYLVEPLLIGPVPFLVALAALHGSAASVVAVGFGALARLVSDAALARTVRAPFRPAHLLFAPLKDMIVFTLWAVAGFRRTVSWRGNRMRIGWGTRLEPIEGPRGLGTERPAGAVG